MWQVCRCGFLISYYHDISETTEWSRVWYCIELVWICIFRTKTNLNHQDIYDEGANAKKNDKMLYMKYISWIFFSGGRCLLCVIYVNFLNSFITFSSILYIKCLLILIFTQDKRAHFTRCFHKLNKWNRFGYFGFNFDITIC